MLISKKLSRRNKPAAILFSNVQSIDLPKDYVLWPISKCQATHNICLDRFW